ncbi:MAG TPA: imidazolonepropionase [Actinomycetota bacterium]|nr:imidazolonepropionase [Actinomycetota bacterium]
MPAVGCSTLYPCVFPRLPVRSPARPEGIRDGVVAWDGDTITYAGPRKEWDGDIDEELAGRTVIPGFVDCHTHLPFFGWRDDEFEARLAGRSYRDLHGEGGIPRSARMLADASDDEVLEFCRPLTQEMLSHGTTALELKTGYGLSVEAELRQARIARRLAEEIPQTAIVTLLACHAIPANMSHEEWVDAACDELIPAAAREGLADAVDVYVEDIAFSVGDLERAAGAASDAGLPLRCHADQLGHSGAAEAAARLGARSADHLNHAEEEGIQALGRGATAAVLLPGSTLSLRAPSPPVKDLADVGAPLALATDLNPGTSAMTSIPEAIALASSLYRLSPAEALAAATINGAWVLGLESTLGSLEPGKRADFLVLEGEDIRMVAYRPGHNPVASAFVGGRPA